MDSFPTELSDLIGELHQLKKEQKEQSEEIKNFNTSILGEFKNLVGKEIFQLKFDHIRSQWGQLNRLETTDAIISLYIESANEQLVLKEEKIIDLSKQYEKQASTLAKLINNQKEAEEVNSLAEEEISQLNSQIILLEEKKRKAQQEVLSLKNKEKQLLREKIAFKNNELNLLEQINKLQLAIKKRESEPKTKTTFIPNPPLNIKMSLGFEKLLKICQSIPEFGGGTDARVAQKLQTFLTCIRPIIEHIPREDESLFLQILQTKLREDALDLIQTAKPKNFKEFEDTLNRTYLPIEDYNDLVNCLITSRQSQFETLNVFISRLRHSLTQCREAAEIKYGENAEVVKTQLSDFAKSALASGIANKQLGHFGK